MIISASRRTDVPAFYSSWLMNRIRAGFCLVPNPFNAKQVTRVSLLREDVDAFVFWSKNPKPMEGLVGELNDRGFVYYFQFTLNDYPAALEPLVPAVDARIDTFQKLSAQLGPGRVVWRYDPIIITPATDYAFHVARFEKLAAALTGATRRVVVSVVDRYRKTDQRMAKLAKDGFALDPDAARDPRMLDLLSHIGHIASAAGMEVYSCAEEADYSSVGVRPGSCVDAELLATLGIAVDAKKDPGQRDACRCCTSRDIGMNNSCRHGCVYCYATGEGSVADLAYASHDPTSPFLIGSPNV